jgi:hypothetical protein
VTSPARGKLAYIYIPLASLSGLALKVLFNYEYYITAPVDNAKENKLR